MVSKVDLNSVLKISSYAYKDFQKILHCMHITERMGLYHQIKFYSSDAILQNIKMDKKFRVEGTWFTFCISNFLKVYLNPFCFKKQRIDCVGRDNILYKFFFLFFMLFLCFIKVRYICKKTKRHSNITNSINLCRYQFQSSCIFFLFFSIIIILLSPFNFIFFLMNWNGILLLLDLFHILGYQLLLYLLSLAFELSIQIWKLH